MANIKEGFLAVAEILDALRVVPRALVAGYALLVIKVVMWYMALEPHIPADVRPFIKTTADAIAAVQHQPSTQHAALVTAVIGFGAAVFGLYTNTGHRWAGSKPTNYQPSQYQVTDNTQQSAYVPPSRPSYRPPVEQSPPPSRPSYQPK